MSRCFATHAVDAISKNTSRISMYSRLVPIRTAVEEDNYFRLRVYGMAGIYGLGRTIYIFF